jgi:hypothetical protein
VKKTQKCWIEREKKIDTQETSLAIKIEKEKCCYINKFSSLDTVS